MHVARWLHLSVSTSSISRRQLDLRPSTMTTVPDRGRPLPLGDITILDDGKCNHHNKVGLRTWNPEIAVCCRAKSRTSSLFSVWSAELAEIIRCSAMDSSEDQKTELVGYNLTRSGTRSQWNLSCSRPDIRVSADQNCRQVKNALTEILTVKSENLTCARLCSHLNNSWALFLKTSAQINEHMQVGIATAAISLPNYRMSLCSRRLHFCINFKRR